MHKMHKKAAAAGPRRNQSISNPITSGFSFPLPLFQKTQNIDTGNDVDSFPFFSLFTHE